MSTTTTPRTRPARWGTAARHTLLIAGSATVIVPFVWMFLTSVKKRSEVFTRVWPSEWHWENYVHAWQAAPFER